ncbi:hypothetical protein K0I73_17195 [Shewanella mesophila]|uniref:hypothetical protein n=1 Tax=Shewanella mesophila TaxID=2864208 RepID=UPI001C65AA19|nr:hypothetical protein [Shewanella mesophila]QYJ85878.1 hypothetical protein K0I73_17195 [Shewanella mesophila]
MKTLIIASSLAIISSLTQANEIAAIDGASNQMNIEQLTRLSQQTDGYEKGYALYRLAINANILGQKSKALSALQEAESLLASEQDNGEVATLLAAIYGMQIGLDLTKGRSYGPKVSAAINTAENLVPDSPRLALVKAISAYSTPVEYGGSMQHAIELGSRAIELFEKPCDNICWGYAEAYTWRGLAKQNLGDQQGAVADWKAALRVQSDYAWASFLLKQNQ